MNIDKFKTLENKLSAAYKNNNLLFIANINTADDYELLTNLQKEDMIIIAEKYQYDIYRKIGIGIISPKDMSFNSCALKCGFSACYLHFAHLSLLTFYFVFCSALQYHIKTVYLSSLPLSLRLHLPQPISSL